MDILRSNPSDSNLEKKCTGPCGRSLPATAQFFHAAEKGKYGLTAKCKDCRLAYQHQPEILAHKQAYDKVYRNLPEIQARNSSYQKAYRANPEKRPYLLAQKRTYYIRTHEKAFHLQRYPDKRTRMKAYRSRPEIQERDRAYNSAYYRRPERQERLQVWKQEYQERPGVREQARAKVRNRRARKRTALGSHTPVQIREQYERQKGKCYYCQHKVEWGKHHVDHVIPLSRGGSNDISNLVIACATCNLRKNSKLPHEWPEGGRLL